MLPQSHSLQKNVAFLRVADLMPTNRERCLALALGDGVQWHIAAESLLRHKLLLRMRRRKRDPGSPALPCQRMFRDTVGNRSKKADVRQRPLQALLLRAFSFKNARCSPSINTTCAIAKTQCAPILETKLSFFSQHNLLQPFSLCSIYCYS